MGWELYDELIAGIPEEVLVKDYCLGLNWTYVEAESGCGVSYTCHGGAKNQDGRDFRGLPLRTMAELAKSWSFDEATLGIAAMNAWYGQRKLLEPLGVKYEERKELPDGTIHKMDAFELVRPRVEEVAKEKGDAHVVIIGHFPHVERVAEYAQLTVLERNCRSDMDTPDPACEYILPHADFVFQTGVTLENKTAPRLFELAKDAFVTMVGPSVVMSPTLFDHGVGMLAGSIVGDIERVQHAVKSGGAMRFGTALLMAQLEKPC